MEKDSNLRGAFGVSRWNSESNGSIQPFSAFRVGGGDDPVGARLEIGILQDQQIGRHVLAQVLKGSIEGIFDEKVVEQLLGEFAVELVVIQHGHLPYLLESSPLVRRHQFLGHRQGKGDINAVLTRFS